MPTNETGPAKAVTVAESTLERIIRPTLKALISTPTLRAYCSPIWNALIGFDSMKADITDITTTTVITLILSQLTAEKLPIDQLWRLTIFESSANVTRNSVTAEHIYPTMTPQTIRTDMLLTLSEIRRMTPVTAREPANAARIITTEWTIIPCVSAKTIVHATTSLAPEEIPRIYGPAIGFAKNVCSRNPETERDPPRRAAASILGIRMSHMIFPYLDAVSCEKRMLTASPIVMEELPISIFMSISSRSKTPSKA